MLSAVVVDIQHSAKDAGGMVTRDRGVIKQERRGLTRRATGVRIDEDRPHCPAKMETFEGRRERT